jgi:TATA-box binding protein (TBP) (component of TFIID and TFIIIB)
MERTEERANTTRSKRRPARQRHASRGALRWDIRAAVERLPPEPPRGIVFKPQPHYVNNVVCTALMVPTLRVMGELAWRLAGAETGNANPVRYESHCFNATLTIHSTTGKVNVTGARSEEFALLALYEYSTFCNSTMGCVVTFRQFAVHNIQSTFGVGALIDIRRLHAAVPRSNHGSLISHVSITIDEPRITALVYSYGSKSSAARSVYCTLPPMLPRHT